MTRRFTALAAVGLACALLSAIASPAAAQPTQGKWAICDPNNPQRCTIPVSPNIVTGQQKVAVTGTAVAFVASSTPLVNGLKFCALTTNSAAITVGAAGVTNTVNGTGNGAVLQPGQCGSIAISDVSLLYLNGTAGDGLSYGPDN